MILSDQTLRKLRPLSPFFHRSISHGMTFGLGPGGYDVRVEFDQDGSKFARWIMPKGFYLAATLERFQMPANVMGIVHDKSSWARRGITVQNTVIEPGWAGYLTLEITNHSWLPVRLLRGMPIAQVVFHFLDGSSEHPYAGKYQDQERGPQEAR